MLALALCGTGSTAFAQTTTPGIKTDLGVYLEPPAPPLPAAGGKFMDPTFGTEIMRVTDAANSGANAGTSYSFWATFNANNTRLLVMDQGAAAGASLFDFDPTTFTLGAKRVLPLNGGGYLFGTDLLWSGTDPNILYGHSGATLYTYNCATQVYTKVFDLSAQLPAGTYFFQASMSADGDVFASTLMMTGTWQVTGYLVYRRSTNTILYRSPDDHNEVRIDKTGRYLYVNTNDQGVGKVEGVVIDVQTGARTNLTDDAPGHAPSHYDVGTDLVVGNANYLPGLTARRLSDPTHFINLFDTALLPNYGGYHLSLLADDESWVFVEFYGPHTSKVMESELVQIRTDGSKQVRRLLHHHSVINFNDSSWYFATPRANISRDGRFVAFTSNWGGSNRRDLFVARIAPSPTTNPAPTPTPTPTPDAAPAVSITTPTNAATVGAGTNVNISAAATTSSSTISRVDFYVDTQFIGATAVAPYNVLWGNASIGSHTLMAKATDSRGMSAMSSPVLVNVTVPANSPPSVRLSSPLANAEFAKDANIPISAVATDSDGTIARVDFYAGTQLIGATSTSPYSILWYRVPAGTYTLTARATDNLGVTTVSAPVSIRVRRLTGKSGGPKAGSKDTVGVSSSGESDGASDPAEPGESSPGETGGATAADAAGQSGADSSGAAPASAAPDESGGSLPTTSDKVGVSTAPLRSNTTVLEARPDVRGHRRAAARTKAGQTASPTLRAGRRRGVVEQ